MRALNGFLRLSKTIPAVAVSTTTIVLTDDYDITGLPIAIEVMSGNILIASGESPTTYGNKMAAGDYREFNAGSKTVGNELRIIQDGGAAVIQIWVYEGV